MGIPSSFIQEAGSHEILIIELVLKLTCLPPFAEKTWHAFEQFWPLLSTSECINGPPTYIARYKGSPPLHAVPPSSLGTGKKVLEPSVRLDKTSEKTLS